MVLTPLVIKILGALSTQEFQHQLEGGCWLDSPEGASEIEGQGNMQQGLQAQAHKERASEYGLRFVAPPLAESRFSHPCESKLLGALLAQEFQRQLLLLTEITLPVVRGRPHIQIITLVPLRPQFQCWRFAKHWFWIWSF